MRAQVLLQPLLSVWLLPSVFRKNKVMFTEVLSTAVSACQKEVIQGSAASLSYGAEESFALSEYSAGIGYVVGTLVYAAATSVKD